MAWNFSDNAPIYLQIVNTLKRDIASGAYPPGTRLPSVRDLALDAGVNPNTMQRALAELERSGLVNSQRTAGRFITEDASALAELRRTMSKEIITELIAKLHSIGMNDNQILEAVQSSISQNTALPLLTNNKEEF